MNIYKNTRISVGLVRAALMVVALSLVACDRTEADIYAAAGGCYIVGEVGAESYLVQTEDSFAFAEGPQAEAAVLRMQASDLGQYVLYDNERHYFAADGVSGSTNWTTMRTRDRAKIRIDYPATYSNAEWALESAGRGANVFLLRHLNADMYLGRDGLVGEDDALEVRLEEASGCAVYPELTLDATGTPRKGPWPNGDVYGYADLHSHLFTNEGFGGGGIFHGAPYHRLGVEHALTDCTEWHGENGKRDLVDFFLSGDGEVDVDTVVPIFTKGQIDGFNHATTGYPGFVDWPNPRDMPTHQQQYYRWLERSYMGGQRLTVQLATGNSALCEGIVGLGAQEAPYGCNDMVSVDKMLIAVRGMERYIDAQHGGPGKGWFRIVETPAEARAVINDGKMAVVLGIEISNVFDCFIVPPEGMPVCDAAHIKAEVEEYYNKGIRVIFPVHKYDNGFAGGDGSSGAIEIGNVMNSGHYGNKISECPDFEHNFDSGPVSFAGLNKPREDYFSEPPFDMSSLQDRTLLTMTPLIDPMLQGGIEGEFCQAQGLTAQGEQLFEELTARGMIIDVAHMPRWATLDAFAILDTKQYPAISTHGLKYDGRIYKFGGLGNKGFRGCAKVGESDTLGDPMREVNADLLAANGMPGIPFAFDMNGFAGSRGPRFGPDSGCEQPQQNPVEYPFTSFDGNVTFTQPAMGNHVIDFNTEGVLHIGMIPETIEDARRDGMSDADLEPLFHSAESFVRLWETIEKTVPAK